jgi:hypothetical protein
MYKRKIMVVIMQYIHIVLKTEVCSPFPGIYDDDFVFEVLMESEK